MEIQDCVEAEIIIAETPQTGERVNCGTVGGVTMSGEDSKQKVLTVVQPRAKPSAAS